MNIDACCINMKRKDTLMKLISFSVTNYRSITTAHKIPLQNFTVLVGKNNEGKSNLLTALNVAMTVLMRYGKTDRIILKGRFREDLYDWKRDFPIQLQGRRNGLESIFKLEFRLDEGELVEFQHQTGIRGNEDIPVSIKIGRDNNINITVPKKGSSSYNTKSKQVASFISQRLSFNYIKAIRTEDMALDVLQGVIIEQLQSLENNDEYRESVAKINQLQQEILDKIAEQLIDPLKTFLPQIKDIHILMHSERHLWQMFRNNIEVIVDDGTPTNISYKGDGIKSLTALAILKDKIPAEGASVIAIEEPESHLHSGAIRSLVDVIKNISLNNQVIITTHNPLFVQQNNIKSNIIVNNGTAQAAKDIAEIRNILGVLPSDNLKNASNVLVVEGEDDKIILNKLLSSMSAKISLALSNNKLVIKPLGGAANLSHDIAELKNCMCRFFVLLDNDEEGNKALEKAISHGLLTEADYKLTICNGSPNSELEDCLKKEVYEQDLQKKFNICLNVKEFRNNKKWSDRIKDVRLSQGGRWTDTIERDIKATVAEAVPEKIQNICEVVIEEKAGFLQGVVASLERMIDVSL